MNRLQSELNRLFRPVPDAAATGAEHAAGGLLDAQGRVRAMRLGLAQTADWRELSLVWRGVQLDLGLPAPAIAVSGLEAIELWFSLAQPVAVAQAQAFLEALRQRYLPELALRRISVWPASVVTTDSGELLPPQQRKSEQWSAFVAPDLAPVFAETPWLDIPPSEEGQADLLRSLSAIKPAEFEAAMSLLYPEPTASAASNADSAGPQSSPALPPGNLNAKQFLLKVMNDEAAPLALRIEAAKALLPYTEGLSGPQSVR
ncbi:hypothetical protein [Roseateles sp. PN1]|uniref:hypothetical protein n=1 Tax=Roseateles sp. PN1 TaxID=3137372 RepID=UPI003138A1F0